MFTWLKNIFQPKKTNAATWDDLLPGDFVRLNLKDPKQVGIISSTNNFTYQRLDDDDIRTKQIDGFVVRTERRGVKPVVLELLEINVVKKKGNNTRLVTYLLLREEIDSITFIEDKKHE